MLLVSRGGKLKIDRYLTKCTDVPFLSWIPIREYGIRIYSHIDYHTFNFGAHL